MVYLSVHHRAGQDIGHHRPAPSDAIGSERGDFSSPLPAILPVLVIMALNILMHFSFFSLSFKVLVQPLLVSAFAVLGIIF